MTPAFGGQYSIQLSYGCIPKQLVLTKPEPRVRTLLHIAPGTQRLSAGQEHQNAPDIPDPSRMPGRITEHRRLKTQFPDSPFPFLLGLLPEQQSLVGING